MKDPYTATISNGKEIYIPHWPVDVSLENLATAGKHLGSENVILISELNQHAAIVALMESKDAKMASSLIKHFVCQARIDGKKITSETISDMFEGELHLILELFTHVMHSQYSSFFSLGLAKVASQEQT